MREPLSPLCVLRGVKGIEKGEICDLMAIKIAKQGNKNR